MIETKTETALTCDNCGRAIAAGETWFQLSYMLTESVFDGTITNLAPVSSALVQLCARDYKHVAPALAALAPLAPPSAVASVA